MNKLRTPQLLMAILLAGATLPPPDIYANEQRLEEVPRIEEAECVTEALVEANADCYLFFGQEDRDDPNGTFVELPVAVIPPENETGNPDPVFFFPGGPGGSPMGRFARTHEDLGDRTLVLIDHRGFIYARPNLSCPGRRMTPYFNPYQLRVALLNDFHVEA